MSLLPEDTQWLAQWDVLVENSHKVLRAMEVDPIQHDIEGGMTVALAQAIFAKARPDSIPPVGNAKTIAGKALRAALIRQGFTIHADLLVHGFEVHPDTADVDRFASMIVRVLAVYGLKECTL